MNGRPTLLRNLCLGALMGFMFVLLAKAVLILLCLAFAGLLLMLIGRAVWRGKAPALRVVVVLIRRSASLGIVLSRQAILHFDRSYTWLASRGKGLGDRTREYVRTRLRERLRTWGAALLEVLGGATVGGVAAAVGGRHLDFGPEIIYPAGIGLGALLGAVVIFSRPGVVTEVGNEPANLA
jgi:hypothetical protein